MQAIILARVSTKEQEEGHSLVAQLNRLHDYCGRKSLDIIHEFTIVESSTRGERPEFKRLITFIKKQPSTVALVCDKVDRLQRSFREVPILEKLRKSNKLVLHFVSDNQILDSNANNSQLMAYHIFVMLAENYTNCISDNVKRSIEKKLREGTILAKSPVGYINTIVNGSKTVIVDPERGDKVKQLFQHYANGVISIAGMVDYAQSIGLNYRTGKALSRSQIHCILHNPFYYGEMKVKGKLYPHIYEPLISKQLFNRCAKVGTTKHGNSHTTARKQFLLTGMIRCVNCGHLYSPYLAKGKYPFLQHPIASTSKCVHHNISERLFFNKLYEHLSDMHISERKLQHILDSIENTKQSDLNNRDNLLLELQVKERQIRTKKARLLDMFLEGNLDKETYEITNKSLVDDLTEIEHNRQNLNGNIRGFYDNLSKCVKIADSSLFLLKSSRFSQKSDLLKLLISNCYVDDKNVEITMRKPFDKMVLSKGFLSWQPEIIYLRTHSFDSIINMTDLLDDIISAIP